MVLMDSGRDLVSRRTQDASRAHQNVAHTVTFDGPFQTTSAILISSHKKSYNPNKQARWFGLLLLRLAN